MKKHICPKCTGEMTKGMIGDRESLDNELRQTWGKNINWLGTGLTDSVPVTTFRCDQCGYLESFAL